MCFDDFADCWAIHCERQKRPTLLDWAPSEEEAARRLVQLRDQDPERDCTQYWVMRLTNYELHSLKEVGFIPSDAVG